MTTSVSNDDVSVLAVPDAPAMPATSSQDRAVYRIRHTLASRFAFLVICVAIVMSALAYGTVHYWALGLFNLGGLTILVLWVLDAWSLGTLRVSRNCLQLPLLGALVLRLVQLLPLRDVTSEAALALGLSNTLSFDPHATRLVLVQLATLLIYFSATLVFIDTPHRLHVMVRTIMIFGFLLAIFGLTQSFTSPTKVYWMRELNQSTAFGPFHQSSPLRRLHGTDYRVAVGIVVRRRRRCGGKKLLFTFVAGLMGVALIMTIARRHHQLDCRGHVLRRRDRDLAQAQRRTTSTIEPVKSVALRLGLAGALLVGLFIGVLMLGGEMSVNRLIVDSVNTNDPTTGRAHFWSVTLQIIKAHPLIGTGLGAFGVVYTKFDSRNGLFRLEQAHNDYLQVLSDGGRHRRGAGARVCRVAVLQGVRAGRIA